MEQKDKFQLGALTDADLRALDSIIMNPLDIGRVAPKLDQMQETYNTQYEIAMDNFNLSNKHGLEDVLNKRNESLDIIEKRKQKFSGGR